MIADLRRRHRRAWLGLAVALGLIFVFAWSARRPGRVMERLPAVLSEKKVAP